MKQTKDKNTLLLSLFLLLVIPFWMGISTKWYSWYGKADNGLWMKKLYDLFDGNWLANIPICTILGFCTYQWCKRIWRDNDCNFFRLVIVIIAFIILFYNNQVEYARVLWVFDYRVFLSILLGIVLLVIIASFIKKLYPYKSKKKEQSAICGFSMDEENFIYSENLETYARRIVNKLLVTNIKKESFAVGISGEWGVGKTAFLNLLKNHLKDKAEIVDFNPWMCRTPEQVTQDFFASLRHQLKNKYSSLSKPIRDYARDLISISIEPHTLLHFNIHFKGNSLYERKQTLSQKLFLIQRPIVVIIDDMDRLERDEVFEVLRLIRNTADLSNLIYLVSYDKEYLACVLEEKKIKDASSFLEKIFPIEIHLPKVDKISIWEKLKSEIMAQDAYHGKLFFKHFNNEEQELILRVLNNYRRIKRFSRIIMLNIEYLKDVSRREINLLDVFWLELLQIYDKPTYDNLSNSPHSLLYFEKDRLRLRNGIISKSSEKTEYDYKGKMDWKEETPNILEKMFGNTFKTNEKSICMVENFDKYFTLNVSKFKLSFFELNEFFSESSDADTFVNKWMDEKKSISSISYQLKHIDVNNLNTEKLKKYIEAILLLGIRNTADRRSFIQDIKLMLRKQRFNKEKDIIVHATIVDWIKKIMEDVNEINDLCNLLNVLYETTYYNHQDKEKVSYPLVINNNEIESLLKDAMTLFLNKHPEVTALEIMKEKSELALMFGNCCVCIEDRMATHLGCKYKQIVFDIVINHFEVKRKKPSQNEYDEVIRGLFQEEVPKFDNIEEECSYLAYMSEEHEQKMQAYFGSSYKSKLEEFKSKCFEKSRR